MKADVFFLMGTTPMLLHSTSFLFICNPCLTTPSFSPPPPPNSLITPSLPLPPLPIRSHPYYLPPPFIGKLLSPLSAMFAYSYSPVMPDLTNKVRSVLLIAAEVTNSSMCYCYIPGLYVVNFIMLSLLFSTDPTTSATNQSRGSVREVARLTQRHLHPP